MSRGIRQIWVVTAVLDIPEGSQVSQSSCKQDFRHFVHNVSQLRHRLASATISFFLCLSLTFSLCPSLCSRSLSLLQLLTSALLFGPRSALLLH